MTAASPLAGLKIPNFVLFFENKYAETILAAKCGEIRYPGGARVTATKMDAGRRRHDDSWKETKWRLAINFIVCSRSQADEDFVSKISFWERRCAFLLLREDILEKAPVHQFVFRNIFAELELFLG